MKATSVEPSIGRPAGAPRRWAANRTRLFWAVAALTALAAAIRLSTLGLQSYRHDEAVTAARVLGGSFGHAMHEVWRGESTPPLYYVLAWIWSQAFGVHETGLRSLSALFGIATVPVAFLIGQTLVGRRTGFALAAFSAVNPILVWYSQDARAYALLILFSGLGFLFFLRARQSGGSREFAWWATCSVVALASHYFAVFPVAIEAVWLLAVWRLRRGLILALAGLAAALAALAPIALHQAAGTRNDWIATFSLDGRLRATAISFAAGGAGTLKHALIPFGLVRAGRRAARLAWRWPVSAPGRRVALIVGQGQSASPFSPRRRVRDYVLDRNLLPALIPLLGIIAAGVSSRGAGLAGLLVAVALSGYWLAFDVYADMRIQLQRDDWRSAAKQIGPPTGPRAILAWEQGDPPLPFYIGGGEQRVKYKQWKLGARPLSEVDVLSGRPPPRHGASKLPLPFHRVEQVTFGRMTLSRYRTRRPVVLSWREVAGGFTGYGNNALLLDRPSRGR